MLERFIEIFILARILFFNRSGAGARQEGMAGVMELSLIFLIATGFHEGICVCLRSGAGAAHEKGMAGGILEIIDSCFSYVEDEGMFFWGLGFWK